MPKRTDISKILVLGEEALKGRAFKARRQMRLEICGFSR
jgi:hypothetical protein